MGSIGEKLILLQFYSYFLDSQGTHYIDRDGFIISKVWVGYYLIGLLLKYHIGLI